MNIDVDDKSGGLLSVVEAKKEPDTEGTAVKQEQNEEAFSIYISSDPDSEDVSESESSPVCSTTAPPTTAQSHRLTHPVKHNLVLSPQESATLISGWKIVDISQSEKMVVCPVCQTLLDLHSPLSVLWSW